LAKKIDCTPLFAALGEAEAASLAAALGTAEGVLPSDAAGLPDADGLPHAATATTTATVRTDHTTDFLVNMSPPPSEPQVPEPTEYSVGYGDYRVLGMISR
jgi:hypothetical protein